jgi:hypothetical protein
MGFVAKDSGGSGDYKRVPSGVFIGRCYQLIDFGTQLSTGQFGEKHVHKIRIGFELFGEDENNEPLIVDIDGKQMPMTIGLTINVSLHKKAGLRKMLEQWRGKPFTEEEAVGFDVAKLLGAYAMVNCTQSEGKEGKIYTNIAGLSPIPSALKNSKPAGVHELEVFDLDKPTDELFVALPQWMQNTVSQSPEYAKWRGMKPITQTNPAVAATIAATAPLPTSLAEAKDDVPW